MKILLIHPFGKYDSKDIDPNRNYIPVGLYYIGATLKAAGHDVEILNWIDLRDDPSRWRNDLAAANPDVIGISVLNFNRWGAVQIAAAAKEINSSTVVVFGGICATYLWRFFLTYFKQIDYVILHEGEYRLLNLLKYLENPETPHPENIDGLAFNKDGAPFCLEANGFIEDLDALADPAQYFDMPVVIHGRGCPYQCTFCGSPNFWKRRVRSHSPEYFVRQLERLRARGNNTIYIADDTLTLDKSKIIKICQRIIDKELDIYWLANSRVDCINDDILFWMRKAGCFQISYGVESGSPEVRKYFGKKFTNDQIEQAIRSTTRYGIRARAYFIIGIPGECWDTIFQSIEIIRRSRPMNIVIYDLALSPPSELYYKYRDKHGLGDEIWLKENETVSYMELEPGLTPDLIGPFRISLMGNFYNFVSDFANSIELVDIPELYPRHAQYLAMMGNDFHNGMFSEIQSIRDRSRIAEKLYRRSLEYFPLQEAYVGLTSIQQKTQSFEQSVQTARQGLAHFPQSIQLAFCLSFGLHQLNRSDEAIEFLVSFHASKGKVELAAKDNLHSAKEKVMPA